MCWKLRLNVDSFEQALCMVRVIDRAMTNHSGFLSWLKIDIEKGYEEYSSKVIG